MNNKIIKLCATIAVTLVLALPVAAGVIPNGVTPPSPTGGDMSAGAAGDISFPLGGEIPNPVTEALLDLLQGLGLLP